MQNFANCHSERSEDGLLRTMSEKSRYHPLYVIEILPPSGRLNDTFISKHHEKTIYSFSDKHHGPPYACLHQLAGKQGSQ